MAIALSCGELFAQCSQLSITTQQQVMCAPSKVKFVLNNLPSSSSVKWDFGNGQINGSDTIYEFFLDPVCLLPTATVDLPGAKSCIVKAADTIHVIGKPQPTFEVSRKKLCDGPDSVTFSNLTPNTASISWVIDGTNYYDGKTDQIHHFKTTGIKSMSMIVIDSFGCRGILTEEDVVEVHEDVQLNFTADILTGCVPQKIQFTQMIKEHGENISSYSWSMEGAQTPFSQHKSPDSVIYENGGEFDVVLSVTTSKGCKHEILKEEYLRFADNNALDITLSDTFLCNKEEAHIDLAKFDGHKTDWTINGATILEQSDSSIRVTFPNPGYYDISLTAEKNGCKNQRTFEDTLHAEWVNSYFASKDYYHCKVPHTVNYRQVSSSSEQGQMKFLWQIYDQDLLIHESTRKSDSTTFTKWGKYTIKLITTHPNGCADTLNRVDFIRVDSIRPKFIARPSIACVDQIIDVESSTPPSSYISSDSFWWTFYEKNKTDVLAEKVGKSVKISFGDTGKYDIQLIAANTIGCRDTLRVRDAVEVIIPELDFSITSPIVCSGDNLQFKGLTKPERANFRHFWTVSHADAGVIVNEQENDVMNTFSGPPGAYFFKYSHKILEGCLDSFTHSDTIKVNGIVASVSIDSNSACTPFVIQPKSIIESNYHYDNNEKDVAHEWTAEPSIGVTISGANEDRPTFQFEKSGVFRIRLVVTNSSGCTDTSYSDYIYAGVRAGLAVSKDSICKGAPVDLIDRSLFFHTSTEWYVEGDGKSEITLDSIAQLRLLDRGDYRVFVVAGKHGKCFDTSSVPIRAVDVESNFTISDTQLYCAPAYAQFEAQSIDADTFFWNFGDGNQVVTTDTKVANIYEKNSGWFEGMDITMVAKSTKGCTDTVIHKDAIKIIGPVPKFKMENFKGCEPLEVSFIDESRDVAKFYMNYNDGKQLDSVSLGSHVYNIKHAKDTQVYNPSLYVIDALGCAAVYKPKDSIVVLKTPTVHLDKVPDLVCFPNKVQTCDKSMNITSRQWFVGGEDFGKDMAISYTRNSNSTDTIILEVTNHLSCKDADTAVAVYRHPEKIELTTSQDPCFNEATAVEMKGSANGTFQNIQWELNGEFLDSGLISSYIPDQFGTNTLKVSAEDQYRCKSEASNDVFVFDPSDIPAGTIQKVSFSEENRLIVTWEDVAPDHLAESVLRESGSGQVIDRFEVNTLNSHIMPFIPVEDVPCVDLLHIDNCGNSGNPEKEHCPVILEASSNKPFTNSLNWSAYDGWSLVNGYRIYRSTSNQDYELIATVNADQLHYDDQDLCELEFTYYVVAFNNQLESRSNWDNSTPLYTALKQDMSVIRATVVDDQYVNVNWPVNKEPSFRKYGLKITDIRNGSVVDDFLLDEASYDHLGAEVHESNYLYEISAIDHCDIEYFDSRPGSNVLLTAAYINGTSILEWTPYQQWKDGVREYIIEILANGSYREVARVSGDVTRYEDQEAHSDVTGAYIYRVKAINANLPEINSLSNTARVVGPSSVWIPNAFTPNKDNLNETFKPSMQFVQQITDGGKYIYELNIYNRWGEKLFSTSEQSEGWNGYYLGKKAPVGSYLYTVRVFGLDKELYNLSGQVLVLE